MSVAGSAPGEATQERTATRRAMVPTAGAAWTAIFFLSAFYLISYVDRLALVVLVAPVKADLGLSDTQIGLLVGTTFAIFYTLFALPMSRIADRANRRNLIFWGALAWNATTALSAFAQNFETLLVLRIGVALGEAVLMPAALSMIADLFVREKRGFPTSVFVGVGATGAAGALIVAAGGLDLVSQPWVRALPLLGDMAEWRLALLLLGTVGLAFTLLFRALVAEPSRPSRSRAPDASVREVALHVGEHWRAYAGFIGATSLIAMINLSVISWYPSNLVRSYGLSSSDAGYLFGVLGVATTFVGGMAIPNFSTWLYRRGRDDSVMWTAIVSTLVATPLLLGALLAAGPATSLLLAAPAFMIQLGMGIMMTGTLALLPPPHLRGQVTALYLLATNLAGLGTGPLVVAWLSDNWFGSADGLSSALIALVVLAVPIQLALLIWSRRAFARAIRAGAAHDITAR